MTAASLAIDVGGWLGVAALLSAYALVSLRRLEADSLVYQMLNLTGGGLLILNSFYYGAYPSVGVNLAWIGIALFTLARRKPRPG
jgi:hypothetical protein